MTSTTIISPRNEPKNVLLLDIDGVLVRPGGYRRSYRDTVNSILTDFGLSLFHLDNDSFADQFEATEIPAEWDMVPLTLAMLFDYLLSVDPHLVLPDRLDETLTVPASDGTFTAFSAYFQRMLGVIGESLDRVHFPTRSVALTLASGERPDLLPYFRDHALCRDIVDDSLNIQTSKTLQRLETFVLGSRVYEATFGLKAEIETESNLLSLDVPLLSESWRQRLRDENGTHVYVAGMTARPDCLDDSFPSDIKKAFSVIPEAQAAFDKLGWRDQVKLIGVGSINTFEQAHRLKKDTFLKPHPFHSVVAIATALTGETYRAMEAALQLFKDGCDELLKTLLPKDQALTVAVCEDSASGIRAVREGVEMLRSRGYDVAFYPYGVQTVSGKNTLLADAGAMPVSSVNEALDLFLGNTEAIR